MRRSRNRGMVLFIVAIVVAMLAVGALALLSLLNSEYEATVLRGDEIQAGRLVQSGVEWIAQTVDVQAVQLPSTAAEFSDPLAVADNTLVDNSFAGNSSPDDSDFGLRDIQYDNPQNFRGIEVVPAAVGHVERGSGRFTIFSPRIEQDRHRGIRYGLVNESSRLHLGAVLQWDIESPGQGARSLLKLPGMTPAMADSILDWIDADKTPRPSGAELEYYEQTGVAFRPRNAIPPSLEEFLWVRDVTRSLLFGTDDSFSYGASMTDFQQGQARTETPPLDALSLETTGESPLPWCFLLTTLSAEKLVDPQGTAKIYLNDGNLEFLGEQLSGFLGEEAAEFVIAWRKNNGNIEDPVDLLDATVTDKETSEEKKSPFSLESAASEEKFLQLLDYATTNSEIVLPGRINVNEAPRIVLETVPELTEEMVQQIVNRRVKSGEAGQRHAVWLLSEKIVDKETMKKLSKRLTTGGDVYRAQVVGFFDGQGTISRAEIVVDATVKPPRPIFSKDLTMFGSGFD